jgi:hypothetical protein
MEVEIFGFERSYGARGAFVYLRPAGAVSSPFQGYWSGVGSSGRISAAVGHGTTLVVWKNYVLRFRNDAPSREVLHSVLEQLPRVDLVEPGEGDCCNYFIGSSERLLLGPISLRKFAGRVPASIAGFDLGARGRVSRFETPAGPMVKITLEYGSEQLARERFTDLRGLAGARVRLSKRQVGLIFDAADERQADELLGAVGPDENQTVAIAFDPQRFEGPLTLAGGFGMICVSSCFGVAAAILGAIVDRKRSIRNQRVILGLD